MAATVAPRDPCRWAAPLPSGRGREAMTYERECITSDNRDLRGAVVSHSAELVRGNCVGAGKAPSSAPTGHLLPKGRRVARGARGRMSFLDEGRVEGLLVVPLGVQLLGVGYGFPGELEAFGAFLAPAEFLRVVVVDEGHSCAHAADAVVERDLGDLLDVQLANLLGVVAGELEGLLDGAQE